MSFHRTYRIHQGKQVNGVFFLAFIHNWEYHLVPISIYEDGMIDCWELVDIDGFRNKVRSGWVVTQPPEGARLSVSLLAAFKAVETSYFIEPEELIKDVVDQIELLNNRPDSTVRCQEAYDRFMRSPSSENKENLREAFEAVPQHKQRFLLRDFPIRMILLENWSSSQVTQFLGTGTLATIVVPDVPNEE